MPLSDVEIWAELGVGRLVIDPHPTADRVDSSSVDLRLHEELVILPEHAAVSGITIDPSDPDLQIMQILSSMGETRVIPDDGTFRLEPWKLVLGKTLEWIELPPHLAARIEGKSSLARLGLTVHMTAPTVQSGFKGRLTLEMMNAGPFNLDLKPGIKIAQLIVEHLGLPAQEGYHGRFLEQS